MFIKCSGLPEIFLKRTMALKQGNGLFSRPQVIKMDRKPSGSRGKREGGLEMSNRRRKMKALAGTLLVLFVSIFGLSENSGREAEFFRIFERLASQPARGNQACHTKVRSFPVGVRIPQISAIVESTWYVCNKEMFHCRAELPRRWGFPGFLSNFIWISTLITTSTCFVFPTRVLGFCFFFCFFRQLTIKIP